MPNPRNPPLEEEEALRAAILRRDPDFNNHLHSPSNVDLEGIKCYICGVAGFPELTATCMDCKSIFVHVYCMKTVQLVVPNDWMCEDCSEIPKQGEILIAFPERLEKLRKMDPVATSLRRCDVPVCIPEQSRYGKRSSGKQIQSKVSESLHNRTASVLKPSPDLNNFKELFIPTRTAKKSRRGSGQGDDSCKVNLKGNKNTRDQRLNASENTRDQGLTGEKWRVDRYLPNHPASEVTWMGCLDTRGLSPPVTVWGYPPGKVAPKAYEFSKKMPVSLKFEAIPRSAVLENMFSDGAPGKYDIGLYFFPDDDDDNNVRSVQHYSCLVSHVEKQDIVLKSCINGVNLLIFSSSLLDEESKEINQAYYLWGLFVPVTTLKESVQIPMPLETNTEAAFEHGAENDEDMDMVGGGAVKEAGCEVQVKLEKWDGEELPSPPGFPSAIPRVVPSVPPGFEECWRVKYKTIHEILQSTNGK